MFIFAVQFSQFRIAIFCFFCDNKTIDYAIFLLFRQISLYIRNMYCSFKYCPFVNREIVFYPDSSSNSVFIFSFIYPFDIVLFVLVCFPWNFPNLLLLKRLLLYRHNKK